MYVTLERLQNYLTTAVEAGIAYWANDAEYVRNADFERTKDGTEVISGETVYSVGNVVSLEMETNTDGKGWQHKRIEAEALRDVLLRMRDDEKLPGHISLMAHGMLTNMDYYYDADDADRLVQYAFFAEIVFG